MEIHRHHSSKTVILILTSVLSFAFVACGDASEKCWESGGQDKKACEKGCNDENSKYRQRACNAACNYGKNLSACSESCKLAENLIDHGNEKLFSSLAQYVLQSSGYSTVASVTSKEAVALVIST